jgi:lysophospholipase L1-like esterase
MNPAANEDNPLCSTARLREALDYFSILVWREAAVTSPEPARALKTVHLIPHDAAIKNLCFDAATQTLRPNLVLVDRQGAVVFEINELGLKGDARDPARKLAVVWGDSVVFGVRWSWPCLLDQFAPGYQFLNGGIEGDPYDNILRRAAAFNRDHAVALNILMLGWHPWQLPSELAARHYRPGFMQRVGQALRRLRRAAPAPPLPDTVAPQLSHLQLRAELLAFLQSAPNTVLVTLPTALNRTIVDQDLSRYFTRGNRGTAFYFAGDLPYSLELQRRLFDHVTERNAIVRDVAQARGLRLVDFAAIFDTEPLADFRADFHDMLHLRPSAYPKAAAAVYQAIQDLL